MKWLEADFLNDYLAVISQLAACQWVQIVLRDASGAVVLAQSSMGDAVAAALLRMADRAPEGVSSVTPGGAAQATPGVEAWAMVARRPLGPDAGTVSIVVAKDSPRDWERPLQESLLQLLHAIAAHVAARRAQQRADEQVQAMARALELAEVGSWTWDVQRDRFVLSPAMLRMLELPGHQPDLDADGFRRAVHPDDRELVAVARAAPREGAALEYRVLGQTGAVRWLRERLARADGQGRMAVVQDITLERHNAQAQRSLRLQAERAQQQFQAIFESSPTPYLVLTPERYQIVAVSDAYLKATMVTREQIMGRELFEVFPDDPADREPTGTAALLASLGRVKSSRTTDVMAVQRYPVRRPQEEGGGFVLKYWSPVNSPVLDTEGKVAFIIHRVEDVTEYVLAHQPGQGAVNPDGPAQQEAEIVLRSLELKRLAASLAESEQRFRYIGRATNDVVWDWDIQGGSLWCSESARQPLGSLLAGVTVLDGWLDSVHHLDRERIKSSLLESVAGRQQNWSAEYRLCADEKACLDILHRCFLIVDDAGRPVRMVGSIADITELKRQENRLREQAELLDYATDAILVRDLDNHVLYWNRAAEQRYGWSAQEVLGRPVSETLYAACPKEEFDQAMQALVRNGDFTGRMIQSARDGRQIIVHAHWILVRHQDGTPRAILSVVTDLSDKIAIEQRLAQVQKLESLGRLTGGIAHDFNNWLTVIIGNAEELVDDLGNRPELAELANMILMAGQRAAELTSRLLAFARRRSLEARLLDVREVLEGARPLLVRSLHENISLQLCFPPTRWQVYVDRSQFEASILNLCINARDAMPAGGKLTIEVSNVELDGPGSAAVGDGLAPGQYVVVAVIDNGRGIPPNLLDRVFEPFFTTKVDSGGSGLGLSMVYGFVKQSNGDVTIESEPNRGTEVKLYLPRSRKTPLLAEGAGAAPAATKGRHILLVEDAPDVRRATGARLSELGYAVTACATGDEALILLDSGLPCDLLFTDVVMPSMSGIELAERAVERRSGLRVLLSSGYPFDAQQRASSHLRYRVLLKPYAKHALVAAIEGALQRAPAMWATEVGAQR